MKYLDYEKTDTFNEPQLFQIQTGFDHHLTSIQVALYADTCYNGKQMDRIRRGLENELLMEEVVVF
ncbi:MAG: hypothetical protein RR219_09140, partial [Clostridiales bacterium]